MRRIRGTKEELTLIQFCNDWLLAKSEERSNIVVRVDQAELTEEEKERVRSKQNTGTLFREFELYEHTSGAWRFQKIAS